MSRPTDRLRYENAHCKQNLRAQLLDIVRKLEDPGVQLVDFSGRAEAGVVDLPHGPADCPYRRQGLSGHSEYTLHIRLYNPAKNALNHLPDLTGD